MAGGRGPARLRLVGAAAAAGDRRGGKLPVRQAGVSGG